MSQSEHAFQRSIGVELALDEGYGAPIDNGPPGAKPPAPKPAPKPAPSKPKPSGDTTTVDELARRLGTDPTPAAEDEYGWGTVKVPRKAPAPEALDATRERPMTPVPSKPKPAPAVARQALDVTFDAPALPASPGAPSKPASTTSVKVAPGTANPIAVSVVPTVTPAAAASAAAAAKKKKTLYYVAGGAAVLTAAYFLTRKSS